MNPKLNESIKKTLYDSIELFMNVNTLKVKDKITIENFSYMLGNCQGLLTGLYLNLYIDKDTYEFLLKLLAEFVNNDKDSIKYILKFCKE